MFNQDVLKKPWYRWYALFILLMVYTSSHVDRQIMGILLEPIKMELNASDTQMGFLVGLTFAIFYATLGYTDCDAGGSFQPAQYYCHRDGYLVRDDGRLCTGRFVFSISARAHWGRYW